MAEQIFGDVPALVLVMDALAFGHFHIVEKGLAERRIARNQQDRLGRDTLARHVEQDEADPALLRFLGGPHEAENPVGLVGIARPHLLPVDDIMVARILGRGREPGEVRSGVGFRIALAPADFAARDLGQIIELLFLAAVFEQRRAEHRNAEAVQGIARGDPAHLLTQHLGFGRSEEHTSELQSLMRISYAVFCLKKKKKKNKTTISIYKTITKNTEKQEHKLYE